jgi:hypothetical protein
MRLDRILIAVPVLGGALLTGTAFAHGVGISTSVRDTVYPGARDTAGPACVHNGVHYNKQGHANCGLHKGWSDEGSQPGEPGGSDQPAADAPAADTAAADTPAGATHGHKADHAATKGGRSADHRPSGAHGKSGSHGKSGTHGKSGSHGKSGTHGASGTHGTSGTHGHGKRGG